MDTLSGQSPFEIVMWTPFTSVNKSNGMYYFDRETSSHIRQEMPKHEDKGLDYLRQKYWNDRLELEVEEGNVVIFSSTLFHGNVVNITPTTRVSINCRFKNLFSPDAPNTKSAERGSGIFYKLLTSSPVTDIGMDYIKYEDSFD
jgi:sporadic carbohydrate cluster 2OG-Fe(II) oxygenase